VITLRSKQLPVPVIVIRRGVHGERQRFNLAHELGHMVVDVQGDDKFRGKAAHRFAGAFLMPAEALWSNVGRHRSSIGWSELFAVKQLLQLLGASVQAITYRCGDLGIFLPFCRKGSSGNFPGWDTGALQTTSRTNCPRKRRDVWIDSATEHSLRVRSRNPRRRSF
jgi:IrrE N-terminal-like domain